MPDPASHTDPPRDLTTPDPQRATLPDTWALCWDLLDEGANLARVPFHTPVLATVSAAGPEVRTVVLRAADRDARTLTCHTDARSAKYQEIRGDRRVSWLFYDPARKLQVRIHALADVCNDGAPAEDRWARVRTGSRRCYLSEQPPGARLPVAGNALPPELQTRRPTPEESESGRPNFAVVQSRVLSLDCLYLDSAGHRRARFDCADGAPEGRWVAP